MIKKLQKIGGSLGFIIPKQLLSLIGARRDQQFRVYVEDHRIVMDRRLKDRGDFKESA